MAAKREDGIEKSNLRCKMTGPYRFIAATAETASIIQKRESVTVSNYLFRRATSPEDKHPKNNYDADDITLPSTDGNADKGNNEPPTHQNEVILREEPDPEPPQPLVGRPSFVRNLNHARRPYETLIFQVQCSDGSKVAGISLFVISKELNDKLRI